MDIDNKKKDEMTNNLVDMLFEYIRPTLTRYIKNTFFPPTYSPVRMVSPISGSMYSSAFVQPKAKILSGSLVVCNSRPIIWNSLEYRLDTIFDVRNYSDSDDSNKSIKELTAFGFGKGVGLEAYGKGPVYSAKENLKFIEENTDAVL